MSKHIQSFEALTLEKNMDADSILCELSGAFEAKSQMVHLVKLESDNTKRENDGLFHREEGKAPISMTTLLWCSFEVDPDESDWAQFVNFYLEPAAGMLGRAFDNAVLANVHRLGLWTQKFSGSQWDAAKRELKRRGVETSTLIVNPYSEGTLLKTPQYQEVRYYYDNGCFMSPVIPAVRCGRTHPAKLVRYGESKEAIVISDGVWVEIGQSAEIDGQVFSVVQTSLEDSKQIVYLDKRVPTQGWLVRFGGIDLYNLVMGPDTFTVATCPDQHYETNVVANNVRYSATVKDNLVTLSILMGVAVDNPSHAIVIKE